MSIAADIHETVSEEITAWLDDELLERFNAASEREFAKYRLYELEGIVCKEVEAVMMRLAKDAAAQYADEMRVNDEGSAV